jgi:hypothetical protein
MIFASPLLADVDRRARIRRARKGAVITSVFVAAGAAVATVTLPSVPTPANVATAYIEARFARDWPGAWELLCGQSRAAIGGYPVYTANANYWADNYFPPSDIEVSVGELHGNPGPDGPSAVVTMSVTSDEGNRHEWEVGGELILVNEGGEVRVCGQSSVG